MKHRFAFPAFIWCVLILLLGSCDWFTDDDADAVEKTLIHAYLEMGEYILFWNGTNDKNEILGSGSYFVRLFSDAFSDQIEMTALEGGGNASNDSTFINLGYQSITELLQNHPNPFKIKDGTNIHFKLAEATTIQITIRNRK